MINIMGAESRAKARLEAILDGGELFLPVGLLVNSHRIIYQPPYLWIDGRLRCVHAASAGNWSYLLAIYLYAALDFEYLNWEANYS